MIRTDMFCTRCGQKQNIKNNFCGGCGRRLEAYFEQIQALPDSRNESVVESLGFLVPETLRSRFAVERRLGTGSVGQVLLARDLNTSVAVAIKLLRTDVTTDQKCFEKFKSEATLATTIHHRNVVEVFEVGVSPDGNVPYIIMEFADGVNLRDVIKSRHQVSSNLFKEIFTQACLGLHSAHSKGIVHRDIKPANIIIKLDGDRAELKLLDFGIAKTYLNQESSGIRRGELYGTPAYMSPEQWNGHDVGPASDIYSLGVAMYELLTGITPFHGRDIRETANLHINMTPPSVRLCRRDIPEIYASIVSRALEKEPSRRFRNVLEIASILNDNVVFR